VKNKIYDKLIQYRLFEIVTIPWKDQEAFKKGIIDENGSIIISRRLLTAEEKKAYPSKFYAYAWELKQILESRLTPARVGRALAKLFDIREKVTAEDMFSPRKIDETGTELFKHYGVNLQPMLDENYDALPLQGEYELRGQKFMLEQALMPVGDIMGFPVYAMSDGTTFTMLEAKKMKTEDGMGAGAVGGGAPANNVGSGNIAGVSPGQEPPGPKGGFKALAKQKRKRITQLRRDAQTLNVVAKEKKE
jgi:hypothetical protein